MAKTKFYLSLLIVFFFSLFESTAAGSDEPKILFIGSSYFTANNLPLLFENLAISNGHSLEIHHCMTNGLYLADHASSSFTESKINEQKWDYVILQGVGSLMAYPEAFAHHPVYPALETLKRKILDNHSETKIIFCLPWAYEDGMTWVQGWTDTYDDMQNIIIQRTVQYADSLGLIIAPVGSAWQRVLREKNYPLHYLHLRDWNHPSYLGSYLMACVVYSTVFFESCIDNSFHGNLSDDDATYFQFVASETVMNELNLWNISTTGIEKNILPDDFMLLENYPNPFNPTTTILYNIPFAAKVQLDVYSINGELITRLDNKFKSKGGHEIKFDAGNLSSGVYILQLRSGNHTINKKILLLR